MCNCCALACHVSQEPVVRTISTASASSAKAKARPGTALGSALQPKQGSALQPSLGGVGAGGHTCQVHICCESCLDFSIPLRGDPKGCFGSTWYAYLALHVACPGTSQCVKRVGTRTTIKTSTTCISSNPEVEDLHLPEKKKMKICSFSSSRVVNWLLSSPILCFCFACNYISHNAVCTCHGCYRAR